MNPVSVRIQSLQPPQGDHPWPDHPAEAASTRFIPEAPPSAEATAPQEAIPKATTPSKNYWRAIGGGSLIISIAIHAGLLIIAAFVVHTISIETRVDFLPGGSSQKGQQAEQQLTQHVQAKKRNVLNKPSLHQRIVSNSDDATIKLPDLPLDNLDLPELANPIQSAMASGGFSTHGLGGLGSGMGAGNGGTKGISFFGLSTALDRAVFILDYSQSMKPNQVDLVVQEMDKTLSKLPQRSQYQVILFAGGARFAGKHWAIQQQRGQSRDTYATYRGKNGPRFYTPNNKASDWAYDGPDDELPIDQWLDATTLHTKDTMKDLEERQLWFGTDWRWPFKMALNMNPPPKVIYFMTDGTGGADVDLILDYKKLKKANVTVNTLLMHTSAGAPAMQRLAKETGGRFSIVFNDSTSVDGKTYFANRKKYDQLLKE